jgi:hypothetical protein
MEPVEEPKQAGFASAAAMVKESGWPTTEVLELLHSSASVTVTT